MRMYMSLWLVVCGIASAQLTPVPPPPTGTPSHPFFITKTWFVGGVGDWDTMTMDPTAHQLFIAHGPTVQVIDVESGTVAGVVKGLREAHSIVLDAEGAYGYVSDGPADMVRVFDRRDFQVIANIPTGPSPRSMVLDPTSGLLFVVGSQQTATGNAPAGSARNAATQRARSPSESSSRTMSPGGAASSVTVIDVERKAQLAQIVLPGSLGFAQGDGNGRVYITVSDRNQILRFDATAIGSAVHRFIDAQQASKTAKAATAQSSRDQFDRETPCTRLDRGRKCQSAMQMLIQPGSGSIRIASNRARLPWTPPMRDFSRPAAICACWF